MPKVFISYTAEERAIVELLSKGLENSGLEVYTPEEVFLPGEAIQVRNAIEESDYVLGVLTRHSVISPWVNQELGYAMASGKPTLLLVGNDVPISALLSERQYARFNEDNPQSALDATSSAIAEGVFHIC